MEVTLKQQVNMEINDVAGRLSIIAIVTQKAESNQGSSHEPPSYTPLCEDTVEIESIEEETFDGFEAIDPSDLKSEDLAKIKTKLIEEANKHPSDFEEEDEFNLDEADDIDLYDDDDDDDDDDDEEEEEDELYEDDDEFDED
jgi:hypothetical protein